MLQLTVSVGEIAVILGLIGTVLANYFGVIRRIDLLAERHKNLDKQVDDIRHGRGLILGPTSDWPNAVRRCFGYVNGQNPPAIG